MKRILLLAFAGALVVGLAACGGGGNGSNASKYFGAIAASMEGNCETFHFGLVANAESESKATSGALEECENEGGTECGVILTFGNPLVFADFIDADLLRCGAAAVGRSNREYCDVYAAWGPTESDAEETVLADCRDEGDSLGYEPWQCRLPSGGERFATCTQ